MTDRSGKSRRAIPRARITTLVVASVFLKHRIVSYSIPNTIIPDDRPKLVSREFVVLHVSVGTKLAKTTKYHPQSNEYLERLRNTFIARVSHYIGEHQLDSDYFAPSITYGYNTLEHQNTQTYSFILISRNKPPGDLTCECAKAEQVTRLSPA